MGDKMGVLVLVMLVVFQMGIVFADPEITIDIEDENLEEGEKAEISIVVESLELEIDGVEVDYGDGNSENFPCRGGWCSIWKDYEYDEGDYRISVIVTTANGTFNETSKKISIEEVEIEDLYPIVSLSSPKNNSLLKTDKVSFRFSASDDVGLDKCTLEIYNALPRGLEYSQVFNNLSKEDVLSNLDEFDDGNYTWKVFCEDSIGQTKSSDEMSFSVQTVLHDKEKEIAALIDSLENFLEKKRYFGLEEKEAIDDLGISDDLNYYKKRLPQIDQDLGTDLKVISDESLREERKAEALADLEKIKKDIPIDFEIVADDKFINNNILESLYDATKDYVLAKGLVLSDWKIKRLGKANLKIQSRFSVTTEIKEIRIKYNNSERNILLVKKNIKIADEMFNVILEKLPRGVNPVFINKVGDIGDSLYEINIDESDESEIIYYIEDDSSIEELREAESILFYEFPVNSFGITGYFSFIGDVGENSSYVVLVLVILVVLGYFGWKNLWRIQMGIWKKEENVRRVFKWIQNSEAAIGCGDFDRAKDNYHNIKKVYGLLPEGFRKYSYVRIEKIRVSLDKSEIADLIREYEASKRSGKTIMANSLYKKIQGKYKKLPKKYQEKVYVRLFSGMNIF